jgi:hypothetical protein
MLLGLQVPGVVRAQAGPPFLTNDPGTPGNANWEINLGTMLSIAHGASSYQLPQIDLNFGLGNRIQLTYLIPYVLSSEAGQPRSDGWGNAYPGVKWRFVDQGEGGWQLSMFPQLETGASVLAQQRGIAGPGPRYYLPLQVARKLGALDLDFEVGYYVPGSGPHERTLGFVAGQSLTERLELDAELYDDRPSGPSPHSTTLDVGGRYRLAPGMIALFMSGLSLSGSAGGGPEFIGYFGIQLLLSDYGRRFNANSD